MKSLEIVDSHIKSIVDYLDNPQVKEDIDCLNIMCVGVSYKELQQIKQDLEVLEILRKHLYIHTSYGDSDYGEYEDKSICINEIHECFCKEDFNKVKQWLEGNDNE